MSPPPPNLLVRSHRTMRSQSRNECPRTTRCQSRNTEEAGHGGDSDPQSTHGAPVAASRFSEVITDRVRQHVGGLVFNLRPHRDGEFEYKGPVSAGDTAPFQAESDLAAEHYQLSVCWPDTEELVQHLDMFLEWQSTCILILPKSVVDKICQEYTSSYMEKAQDTLLILVILSITYLMNPGNTTSARRAEVLSDQFFTEARKLAFEIALKNPCVQVVQATCILSCREYSRGSENGAWIIHGTWCCDYLQIRSLR